MSDKRKTLDDALAKFIKAFGKFLKDYNKIKKYLNSECSSGGGWVVTSTPKVDTPILYGEGHLHTSQKLLEDKNT